MLVAAQVLAFVVVGAARSGGDGAAAPRQVTLGEMCTLTVGGTAVVRGEDLQVGFDRVLSDSRCPRGTQCIAQGGAAIQVWLFRPPQAREAHELRTTPSAAAEGRHGDYRIRLVGLEPYPQADRTTRPADYVATLAVTR
jgi:hypothetical protein